jgi:hypothetical protein
LVIFGFQVALIHIEEAFVVYQKQIQGQVASGINSMKFVKLVLEGIEKNILLVATEDSSVLAIEEDTGNALSPNTVQTKNPSRALSMHVLGELPIFVLSVLLSCSNYTGLECMNLWHFFLIIIIMRMYMDMTCLLFVNCNFLL